MKYLPFVGGCCELNAIVGNFYLRTVSLGSRRCSSAFTTSCQSSGNMSNALSGMMHTALAKKPTMVSRTLNEARTIPIRAMFTKFISCSYLPNRGTAYPGVITSYRHNRMRSITAVLRRSEWGNPRWLSGAGILRKGPGLFTGYLPRSFPRSLPRSFANERPAAHFLGGLGMTSYRPVLELGNGSVSVATNQAISAYRIRLISRLNDIINGAFRRACMPDDVI